MWNKLRIPLLTLSVTLNVAFVAVWLAHTIPDLFTEFRFSQNVSDHASISSSLYRELGVTSEQWEQMEPHIQHFRENAEDQRRKISMLRGQLMELLAEAKVDEKAIRAKQEEILAGQEGMQNLVIELLLKEKEILTPEQQKALLKVIHQHCNCLENNERGSRGIGRVLSDDKESTYE